jgi:hypothetical protein
MIDARFIEAKRRAAKYSLFYTFPYILGTPETAPEIVVEDVRVSEERNERQGSQYHPHRSP